MTEPAVTVSLRTLWLHLFAVAALVMFVFMLIASLADDQTCLGQTPTTWLAAGLMAFMLELLVTVWRGPAPAQTQVAPPT